MELLTCEKRSDISKVGKTLERKVYFFKTTHMSSLRTKFLVSRMILIRIRKRVGRPLIQNEPRKIPPRLGLKVIRYGFN